MGLWWKQMKCGAVKLEGWVVPGLEGAFLFEPVYSKLGNVFFELPIIKLLLECLFAY